MSDENSDGDLPTDQPNNSTFGDFDDIIEGTTDKPPRLMIYGTEGIGKSTVASQAPNPIFVQTENGLGRIDCKKFPVSETFESVCANIERLLIHDHPYQTLVIDTLDWLERLIWARTCRDWNVKSIELAAGGYGKGYGAAMEHWQYLLSMLDAASDKGMIVILLAHAQVERHEDPESPAYDRYSPKLHKKSSGPLVSEWSEAVLFATRKIRVEKEESNFKKVRTRATGIGADGGDRILKCIGSPSAVAKNRFGLPYEIPLSWDAIVSNMNTNKH